MADDLKGPLLETEMSGQPITPSGTKDGRPKGAPGPLLGVIWFVLTFIGFGVVSGAADYDVLHLIVGWRSMIALSGYLVMQVGLWHAENKWDEEGSAAWLRAAAGVTEQVKGAPVDGSELACSTPEELDASMGYPDWVADLDPEAATVPEVTIPEEEKHNAFPVPWGFLIGWWLWGCSLLFPIDGSSSIHPTDYGIAALAICVFVSLVASVPMADAVMNRLATKKTILSLMFLFGWIALGIMTSLDVTQQLNDMNSPYDQTGVWLCCMLGPFTIILSQKILFESRKMGTLWETTGMPNFHPIVYNMGGPLFVWGWFFFWVGVSAMPGQMGKNIYESPGNSFSLPLFLNWRTMLAFGGGCAMVPVVGFLDYSHDEDGPWCGENNEEPKAVFSRWWLGTDGTYFGLFLESPWPFVMAWTIFGISSFFGADNSIHWNDWRAQLMFLNCVAQGIDAGILIQANLYAGNMAGKNKFSIPFVFLFICLAINIGSHWNWQALGLALPGAVLIVLGQKTVFAARKRGDYTMQNQGKANPYGQVFVYSWGEVFFMMGWIIICWAASMP